MGAAISSGVQRPARGTRKSRHRHQRKGFRHTTVTISDFVGRFADVLKACSGCTGAFFGVRPWSHRNALAEHKVDEPALKGWPGLQSLRFNGFHGSGNSIRAPSLKVIVGRRANCRVPTGSAKRSATEGLELETARTARQSERAPTFLSPLH